MENSDLLQALLQVPPNLAFAREQLLSGRYSPQQVTELGYHYAEEYWNEDLDADNSEFYSEEFDYYWREANTIAERHSFYLYEVIDLLLKHGLNPNYTVDGDYCLMEFVIGVVNGYIAADTLILLLESGGNPNLISSGENMFDQICFDVDFNYATAEESAKVQATSVFQRFMEYQYKGGKDSLEKFLADRHYTSEDVLNDPIYEGQVRLIPADQLKAATTWLQEKIVKEATIRPEQVKRYQDTLDLLKDRIADNEGNESIPLSKADAEKLATLAKEGKFNAEDFDITAPELINLEMVVKTSLKAGASAAIITLVLKIGPEIYKTIDYLIKNGEIDGEHFKQVGFAAITGSSESFVRGSVAAAISACCKSGALGEALKEVSPGVIGTVVAVTMNTMKNAFQVVKGKKSRTELTDELLRDLFVSSSALGLGTAGQVILPQLPVVGYLVGSFVGSIVGTFVYNTGYKAALSFCTETGVTLFGLVQQDYKLPDDIIEELGLETFSFDTFSSDTFEADSFAFDTFAAESIQPETLGITMLRRGVIGVSKIGFVN